jgi:hypothetical protein
VSTRTDAYLDIVESNTFRLVQPAVVKSLGGARLRLSGTWSGLEAASCWFDGIEFESKARIVPNPEYPTAGEPELLECEVPPRIVGTSNIYLTAARRQIAQVGYQDYLNPNYQLPFLPQEHNQRQEEIRTQRNEYLLGNRVSAITPPVSPNVVLSFVEAARLYSVHPQVVVDQGPVLMHIRGMGFRNVAEIHCEFLVRAENETPNSDFQILHSNRTREDNANSTYLSRLDPHDEFLWRNEFGCCEPLLNYTTVTTNYTNGTGNNSELISLPRQELLDQFGMPAFVGTGNTTACECGNLDAAQKAFEKYYHRKVTYTYRTRAHYYSLD